MLKGDKAYFTLGTCPVPSLMIAGPLQIPEIHKEGCDFILGAGYPCLELEQIPRVGKTLGKSLGSMSK